MLRTVPAPFVGRVAERRQVAELLSRVEAGTPSFVLVSGDAGAGKSRLLGDAAEQATARGFSVHLGSCVQLAEFSVPYLPISDVLRSIDNDPFGHELLTAEGPGRQLLARLLPQLHDSDAAAPAAAQSSVGPLYEAVLQVLLALSANTPLVVVLEDLHWADASTRDLLNVSGPHAATRPRRRPGQLPNRRSASPPSAPAVAGRAESAARCSPNRPVAVRSGRDGESARRAGGASRRSGVDRCRLPPERRERLLRGGAVGGQR